jgi:hypothetical protein
VGQRTCTPGGKAPLGMPGSIPQRERSTQKPGQGRRARTAGSGCPQPAGQSSSAAYRIGAEVCALPQTRADHASYLAAILAGQVNAGGFKVHAGLVQGRLGAGGRLARSRMAGVQAGEAS